MSAEERDDACACLLCSLKTIFNDNNAESTFAGREKVRGSGMVTDALQLSRLHFTTKSYLS